MTRFIAAVAVLAVAVVAAVISYSHVEQLALSTGQSLLAARLLPVSIDGLVLAASMVLVDCARRGAQAPVLGRVLLGLGVAATLAANAAAGASHGPAGIAVSMWPAVAFIGSAEAFLMLVRGAQEAPEPETLPSSAPAPQGVSEPAPAEAPATAPKIHKSLSPKPSRGAAYTPAPADVFAQELAAGRVPGVRSIKSRMHCGQDRAVQIKGQLEGWLSQSPVPAEVTS